MRASGRRNGSTIGVAASRRLCGARVRRLAPLAPCLMPLLFGCGWFGDEAATSTFFIDAKPLLVTSPKGGCQKFNLDAFGQGDYFSFGRTDDGKEISEPGVDENRVFAAVFDKRPDVHEGRIRNFAENAVWVWHSEMKSEGADPRNGVLHFTDGIGVRDGLPEGTDSCGTLKACKPVTDRIIENRCEQKEDGTFEMKHYYFVVWAWNSDREIAYYSDNPPEFCFSTTEAEPCSGSSGSDGGTPDGATTETCSRPCSQ